MLPGPAGDSRPDLRLVPAACACWAAVAWALAAPLSVVVAAALAAAGTAVVAAAAGARRPRDRAHRVRAHRTRTPPAAAHRKGTHRVAHTVLACAALCATLSATAAALAVREAGPFPQWVGQQAVADVVGRVVSDPHLLPPSRFDPPAGDQRGGNREGGDQQGGDQQGGDQERQPRRYAVRLDVDEVAARGERRAADAMLLVLGDQSWSRVRVGSRVQVTGRFVPSEPGDDVAGLFRAFGAPQERAPPAWWWRAAERPRQGLRDAVSDRSPAPGGLLPSLVVGDTSLLTPTVEDELRTSGLTHLTAVSGANVAIVTGSALWLAVSVGLLRRARVVVAALALVGFVVMARPEPSVLRAAAMGTVMLAGLLSSRRSRGVPALAATVVALLVLDPWLARNAGFALSVVATGSLLLLVPPWASRLERVMPQPLALALAAPAAAQAACAPLLVMLEPSVSLVAVPANLLAGPAVLPATVLGVVAALLSVVWPGGGELVAAAGCLATWWITEVAARASAVPGAQIGWLPGVSGAVLLAVLTTAAVLVSMRLAARTDPARADAGRADPARSNNARTEGRWRPVAACAAVVLVVLAGWWLAGRGRGWAAADWAVAMCDVGQGDAMVVRSGPDRAVLVDAGPEPAPLRRCLDDLGIRALDLVVLTHFHADHVRGLSGALAGRQVGPVLVSPLGKPAHGVEAVEATVASVVPVVSTRVVTDSVSGAHASGGWALRWQVTHVGPRDPSNPSGEFEDHTAGDSGGSTDLGEGTLINDASLVMMIEQTSPAGVRLRVIGLGDLEREGQSRLLRLLDSRPGGPSSSQEPTSHDPTGHDPTSLDPIGPVDKRVDVVKVAHHGSARQDPALYRRLGASLALIGVGDENDYGHPTPSALAMLAGTGATVMRTDRDGSIAVSAQRAGGLADPNRVRLTAHRAAWHTGMARLLPTWFTAGLAGGRTR